jgi:hypothetical protein
MTKMICGIVCFALFVVSLPAEAEKTPTNPEIDRGIRLIMESIEDQARREAAPITRGSFLQKDFDLYVCILDELERRNVIQQSLMFSKKLRIIPVTAELHSWILGLSDNALQGFTSICNSGSPEEISMVAQGFLVASKLIERIEQLNRLGWREPWQPKLKVDGLRAIQ